VWSIDSKKVISEIEGTAGVHGVALAQDLKRGFTSNGRSNTVTVFDLETLKVVETISIPGDNPDAILYEPKFKRVYCFNGRSGNVTVIDAVNLKVLANVALGGKPEVAVSDGAGHVLVNVEDSAELVVIDQAANEVQARWPLAPSRPLHQPYGRGPRCSPSTAIFRLRQPQDGDSRCTVGAASCNHGDRRRTGRGRI
jgi:YVTN family beta-propeller protein